MKRWHHVVLVVVAGVGLTACGAAVRTGSIPAGADAAADVDEAADYDPWQAFNEKMFFFNHDILDHYVVKPLATGWDKVVPDVAKRGLSRAFDNLGTPKRLVNNLLQGRLLGAGREVARFAINTTVGIAGFVDVARNALDIEQSDADTGQTLGVFGFGPGPYLVLPTLAPLTVRDGIGYGVDGLLAPWDYFLPTPATAGMSIVKQVNERALNLAVFDDVEESVLDLYSAVRNGYLQRRRHSIEEADAEWMAEWHPRQVELAER